MYKKLALLGIGLNGQRRPNPRLSRMGLDSGSTFEALEALRAAAMFTANHPQEAEAARRRIATLRAEIRTGEPLSLLKGSPS